MSDGGAGLVDCHIVDARHNGTELGETIERRRCLRRQVCLFRTREEPIEKAVEFLLPYQR